MGKFGLDDGSAAIRRRPGRTAAAGAESNRQADLPGKISPEGIGQIGAVGGEREVFVFVEAEIVVGREIEPWRAIA